MKIRISNRSFNFNLENMEANKDVNGLIIVLKDEDSDVRLSAAKALDMIA